MDMTEGGRVQQKQRTRTTLLETAAALLQGGMVPTVIAVAEAAGISRATAYRYFRSQELLVSEAVLHAAVPEIADLLAPASGQDDPEQRLDRLVERVQQWVAMHETSFRAFLRLSLDTSLGGEGGSGHRARGGRRIVWIESVLEPLRNQLSPERFSRLVAAISLFLGIETRVVLKDICGLGDDDVESVSRWAATALLREALRHPEG